MTIAYLDRWRQNAPFQRTTPDRPVPAKNTETAWRSGHHSICTHLNNRVQIVVASNRQSTFHKVI